MSNATPYAPQIKVPELLERGKTQLTTLPIYRDGVLMVVNWCTRHRLAVAVFQIRVA